MKLPWTQGLWPLPAEISPGEEMDFGDYLYCAMVKSANEACNVIATAVAGNIQNFINRMNTRAAELGAKNTYFSDTNGLSDTGHYTTAYDLFLISREAMSHPLFVEISDTLSYEIAPTNIHKQTRVLKNSNALLTRDGVYGDKYVYPGASGVKTGYTSAAGYCLVSTAEKNDMHLLAVVLGCDGLLNTGVESYGNFSGTINLYDWGFRNICTTGASGTFPIGRFFPTVRSSHRLLSSMLSATRRLCCVLPRKSPCCCRKTSAGTTFRLLRR